MLPKKHKELTESHGMREKSAVVFRGRLKVGVESTEHDAKRGLRLMALKDESL